MMQADEGTQNKSQDKDIVMEVWDASDWLTVVSAEHKEQDKPLRRYKSNEIQSLANISKAQLVLWTKRGCVLPLKDPKLRGGHRTYSHRNLIEAMICRELNAYSVETALMREILDWLRRKAWIFRILTTVESDSGYYREMDTEEGEVFKKVMQMIANRDIPRAIRRRHTVLEFLSFYPVMGFDLFLAIPTHIGKPSGNDEQKSQGPGITLFSNYNINEVLSNITSSIIVNLTSLKIEAGGF